MKLSIIIATANRNSLLQRCLESINSTIETLANIELEVEILVIINGLSLDTEKLVSEVLKGLPNKIIQINDPLHPGSARNLAFNKATGDWVLFLDDDVYFETSFFEAFVSLVNTRPEYSVFGGPNVTPPNSSRFQKLSGVALECRFASFHCSQRYSLTQELPDVDDSALTLCNLFIKKSAIGSGFSKHLVCAEENQLLYELASQGHRFLAHPLLKVFHERRNSYNLFAQQVTKYGKGRGQLILNGQAKWYHFVPLVFFSHCIGLPFFSHSTWLVGYIVLLYFFLLTASVFDVCYRKKCGFFDFFQVGLLISSIHLNYAIGVATGLVYEFSQKVSFKFQTSKTQ